MVWKKISLFFLILCLFCGFSSASISLDKTEIIFEGNPSEEICNQITVSSDDFFGDIIVRDRWSEDPDGAQALGNYLSAADDVGVSVSYIDTLVDFDERSTVEVCVVAEQSGDYNGAIIFKPQSGESLVFELGAWLTVNIQETETQEETQQTQSSGGSGGGSGITTISVQETEDEKQEGVLDYENLGTSGDGSEGDETNLGDSAITGKAVDGDSVFKIGILQIIPFIFIALLVGAKIYVKRKNKLLNFSSN